MLEAGRAIADLRDTLVREWADWLGDRMTSSTTIPRSLVERELRLIIDVLVQLVGPYRRETAPVWERLCEHYGQTAAARGLAAGEVVEELQYLRELLTRNLAPMVAAMRARQGMAMLLHLNRMLDRGVSAAVVGYTNALVATLFSQNGVPASGAEFDAADVERRLVTIEEKLVSVTGPS